MSIEKCCTAPHAHVTGGREGTGASDDGNLNVKLTTPKELGGAGAAGTNPEQLFAVGYAACFLGALKFVAGRDKIAMPCERRHRRLRRHRPDPDRLRHRGRTQDLFAGNGARRRRKAGRGSPHRLPVLERDAWQHRCDADDRLTDRFSKAPARRRVFRLAARPALGVARATRVTPAPGVSRTQTSSRQTNQTNASHQDRPQQPPDHASTYPPSHERKSARSPARIHSPPRSAPRPRTARPAAS